MTRSAILPVDVIRRQFAKALGVRLGKILPEAKTSRGMAFEMKAIVNELKSWHLSALVDLIYEYNLNASTVFRWEYGIMVVLRKKAVRHPEDSR